MVRYWKWIKCYLFTIKFLTKSIGSSLCDYSDVYVLVTGNITVEGSNNNTKVAFTDCAPFRKCRTEINDTFFVEAEHINIALPMYILIEYSDHYSDHSGSLWQLKKRWNRRNYWFNCTCSTYFK